MTEEEKEKWINETAAALSKAVEEFYNKTFGIIKLTDDERAILRNINQNNFDKIGRENGMLYLGTAEPYLAGKMSDEYLFYYMFSGLFKFIKDGEVFKISELLKE